MPDRPRLLVVEDESIVAMDLADSLRQLGYDVVGIVASGTSAVETATTTRPDLILIDIRLRGDMNGIEAARLCRGRADIPATFLTAPAHARTLERTPLA